MKHEAVVKHPQGEPLLLLWFRVQSLRLYPRSRTLTLQYFNHTLVRVYTLFASSSSHASLGPCILTLLVLLACLLSTRRFSYCTLQYIYISE
jgi:uncharacterized membrane protein YjdF